MAKLTIDNTAVEVPDGSTVLDAARSIGIDIPTLCHLKGCTPNTSCLVCLVRVNNGKRLLPSCATKVAEGMTVESETETIHEARRTALELLLSDHAGDCLAPCTNVCPAHMDIPTMIRQIESGDLRDALITVKQRIALPAVLGRICPELCEKGCRRGDKDAPVAICRLKRHVADEDLASENPYLPECLEDSGKSVAIVGTGPTGLAAAYYLLQRGHRVTLLDHRDQPGGNLRYAIDDQKLPRHVLDAEIGIIKKLGADFRFGVRVGSASAESATGSATVEADLAYSLPRLKGEFDAVLLAVGEIDAVKAKALDVAFAGKGLKTDRKSMLTSIPGVFAAGAAVTPFKHAIRAVAEGRSAAVAIDRFLRTGEAESELHAWTVRLGVLSEGEQLAIQLNSSDRPRTPNPYAKNFSVLEAFHESTRCLECDCSKLHDCRLRAVSMKYDADPMRFKVERRPYEKTDDHPFVTWEAGKCIACGLCVQIATREMEPLGFTHIGRGFHVKIGAPFSATATDALSRAAELCARACPTAALTLRSEAHLRLTGRTHSEGPVSL